MPGKSFRVWLYDAVVNRLDERSSESLKYLFKEAVSRERVDLRVPFEEKDRARALGARWDNGKRVWYIPPGVETSNFQKWMAAPQQAPQMPQTPQGRPQMPQQRRPSGNVAQQRIDLQVPFEEKDMAKAAGARWDSATKRWYAPPGTPLDGLSQWIPDQQGANPYDPRQAQQPGRQPGQPAQLRPGEAEGEPWICGTAVEGNEFGMPAMVPKAGGKPGEMEGYKVIARGPDANGLWEMFDEHMRGREGLTTDEIKKNIVALRDETNKVVKTKFPMNYLRPKGERKKKKNLIDTPSEEQASIDARFEGMINSRQQDHMMISALAGTGKTTILKHLAWKYGRPGQKWLYLVFNTKNKEEATPDFPEFVNVQTTNGFLGKMLGSPENMERFPQTNWMASLDRDRKGGGKGGGGRKLEKSRIIADTPEFAAMMDKLGVPDPDKLTIPVTSQSTLGILRYLRNHFQRTVLKLLGLAKSYALDPRNQPDAMAGLELLIEDYESQVDVRMTEVKDSLMRMAKKNPYNYYKVIADLDKIFGGSLPPPSPDDTPGDQQYRGFYTKSFKNEVMQATYWMMQQMMPHASQHKYRHDDGTEYNLADFRDFDDDFWYSAIHSSDPNNSEIHWPHYDVVLADEVQDFNEDQKIMLQNLAAQGAKIVAVGDVNQAMYRFRGADSEAFHSLGKDLAAASTDQNIQHGLTLNFRSRPAILQNSNENTHVKDLKAGREFPDKYPGQVLDNEEEYDDAFDKLKWEQKKFGYRKETAFIARTNEPLVHAALKLMTEGIPFVIVGKDISKSLRDHIGKIKRDSMLRDYAPVSDLADAMDKYFLSEEEVFQAERTKDSYLKELKETTEALISAINQFKSEASNAAPRRNPYDDPYADDNSSDPTIKEFENWIYQRLGGLNVEENAKDAAEYKKKLEEQNPVVLTTAHKSKGLEFERVYLLRADQFPHPRSRNSPKDMAQEANTKYVAYTRPRNDFSILKLDNQPGYEKPKVGGGEF